MTETSQTPKYLDWEAATPVVARWMRGAFSNADFPVRTGDGIQRRPMSVNVDANLDGFLINCWDDHRASRFGTDFLHLMPIGPQGMGLSVAAKSIDEPGLRGRIEAAVREALATLAAHRDGKLCTTPHPRQAEYKDWRCLRPAGHDQLLGWRSEHAMTDHRWNAAGEMLR